MVERAMVWDVLVQYVVVRNDFSYRALSLSLSAATHARCQYLLQPPYATTIRLLRSCRTNLLTPAILNHRLRAYTGRGQNDLWFCTRRQVLVLSAWTHWFNATRRRSPGFSINLLNRVHYMVFICAPFHILFIYVFSPLYTFLISSPHIIFVKS